ncbi:hypothetical protein HPP92_005777 [Vanilla planifolia]|uniref:Uncharacterized protein n=2 Tax=Vanilla planifolia TaxID=51239 RepID=A0A835RJ64_VANPL|nr:hypothetical protein HPP92_005777 [Vanilla planifolia]
MSAYSEEDRRRVKEIGRDRKKAAEESSSAEISGCKSGQRCDYHPQEPRVCFDLLNREAEAVSNVECPSRRVRDLEEGDAEEEGSMEWERRGILRSIGLSRAFFREGNERGREATGRPFMARTTAIFGSAGFDGSTQQ